MTDNSTQEEPGLLEEEEDDNQQNDDQSLIKLISQMNKNMMVMGESIKRMSHSGAETAAKKARLSPEPGDSALDELLNDGINNEGTSGDKPETEDSLFDEIMQSLNDSERTAEPVPENLAKVANTSWLHKLSEEQLKAKTDKYHKASNCTKMVVPKVNEEIWGKLGRSARGKDVKYQHLQTNMTKVGHIAVKLTESIMALRKKAEPSSEKSFSDLLVLSTDAIALLGHSSFTISQLRREDIKPNLHKDYATLCSANVPVTDLLFGDELQTQLTHIRAANKIGNTASSSSNYRRNYNSDNKHSGRHFLHRANPAQSRGTKRKYNNYQSYTRTKSAETQPKK